MSEKPDQELDRKLDREKRLAARAALRWVRSGMTLGLGSGSTARHFIRLLGEQIRSGALAITAVASSRRSEAAAAAAGIPLVPPRRGLPLDLTVDGADQIAPNLDLLKGRGGALLREKVLAYAARYFLVIGDSSKRVERLGKLPVPVEVLPFALPWVAERIDALGGKPRLRLEDGSSEEKPFCTDQQNHILDCDFGLLEDPRSVADSLHQIPGVIGHGLFLGCTQAALVAEGEDVFVIVRGGAPVRLADLPGPFGPGWPAMPSR